MKTYSELMSINSFVDRYKFLQIPGIVGEQTFGSSRFLNQEFYRSREWKSFRNSIIIRDQGRDLGVLGHDIFGLVIVHHINPITEKMLRYSNRMVLDPENVICVSSNTHKAIHYGEEGLLMKSPIFVEREPNDTIPWR